VSALYDYPFFLATPRLSKRKRKITRDHSDRINDDDGVDPRVYFAPSRRLRSNHRKAWQLCRQVQDTLQYVLHGDGGDEVLNSLSVVSVQPAPDTARLLVLVQSDLPFQQVQPDQVVAMLGEHAGRLRTEIASSIHRKKTPQLLFQLVPPANFSASTDVEVLDDGDPSHRKDA